MPGSYGRLVRPVERQGMKDWLIERLDGGQTYGLEWVDKSDGKFRIKWLHGSRQGWSTKETAVFEAWAKHTDRHRRDPKRWKANFRCAIKSLKEVKELTSESATKGQNAYRVFQIRGMVGQRLSKTPGRRGDDDDEEDDDDNDGDDEDGDKERNVIIPDHVETLETLTATNNVHERHRECEGQHGTEVGIFYQRPQSPVCSNSYSNDLVKSSGPDKTQHTNLPIFEKINPDLTKLAGFIACRSLTLPF